MSLGLVQSKRPKRSDRLQQTFPVDAVANVSHQASAAALSVFKSNSNRKSRRRELSRDGAQAPILS